MNKLFLILLIFYVNSLEIFAIISDRRLCGDPKCAEPVSEAVSLIRYNPIEPHMLSFKANTKMKIFSKSAGSNLDLWGAEINGKRGYVPKSLIKETKVLKSKLNYLVETEVSDEQKSVSQTPIINTNIPNGVLGAIPSPDKVVKPYEVLDGTTIYHETSGAETMIPPKVDIKNENVSESDEIEVEVYDDEDVVEDDYENVQDNTLVKPTSQNQQSPDLTVDSSVQNNDSFNSNSQVPLTNGQDTATEPIKPEVDDKHDREFENRQQSRTEATIPESSEKPQEELIENNADSTNEANKPNETPETSPKPTETPEEVPPPQSSNDFHFEDDHDNLILAGDQPESSSSAPEPKNQPENLEKPTELKDSASETSPEPAVEPSSTEKLETIDVDVPISTETPKNTDNTSPEPNFLDTPPKESPKDTDNTSPEPNFLDTPPKESPKNTDNTSPEPNFLDTPPKESPKDTDTTSPEPNFLNTPPEESPNLDDPVEIETSNAEAIIETTPNVEFHTESQEVVNDPVTESPNLENNPKLDAAEIVTDTPNIETVTEQILDQEPVVSVIEDPKLTESIFDLYSEPITTENSGKLDDIFQTPATDPYTNDILTNPDQESGNDSGYFDGVLEMFGYLNIFEYMKFFTNETSESDSSVSFSPQDKEPRYSNGNENSNTDFDHIAILKISDSYNVIIYMIITSITVLIFTLGYYYIERSRQDSKLIRLINELDKERNILKNELELIRNEEPQDYIIEELKQQLEESERIRSELEELNSSLEKELETATEAGLELNRLLTECLNSQSGDSVEESLEFLQKQLNDQQFKIAEMTVSLNDKTKENELIQFELNKANVKISELTNELNALVDNLTKLEKEALSKEEELNKYIKDLQTKFDEIFVEKNTQITNLTTELNQVKDQLKEVQHNLNVKEHELELLKENVMNLQKNKTGDVQTILDVSHVRAELQEVTSERDKLFKKLQSELEAKKTCENQIAELNQITGKLKEQLQNVEKEKIEVQTRLDVLSSYFKEKEAQLQKEIVKHEELWLQNKDANNSTVERIKLLQEEIQNYKLQNEMLRNEIVDQEVSLKSQISVLEKKNHENWLLLRQAERRLEDSKQECSQLRNRLIIVERSLNAEEKIPYRVLSPLNSTDNVNSSPIHVGDPSASPPPLPFMSLPPPPPPPGGLPFLPPPPPGAPLMPPPPNLFPGDRRPPPLGRMSSPPPPPPTSFSPPPAFSPYDQDPDSPSMLSPRDRMYDDYDNEHSYPRHPSPPMFAPSMHHPPPPPPSADASAKMNWDDRANFHLNEQRVSSKQKGNNMIENA